MDKDGPPLNGKAAAKALGVSYPTLLEAVKRGQIPAPYQLGNLKLFPRIHIWRILNGEFNQPPQEP